MVLIFFSQNCHYDIARGDPETQRKRQIHLNWMLLSSKKKPGAKKRRKNKVHGRERRNGPLGLRHNSYPRVNSGSSPEWLYSPCRTRSW